MIQVLNHWTACKMYSPLLLLPKLRLVLSTNTEILWACAYLTVHSMSDLSGKSPVPVSFLWKSPHSGGCQVAQLYLCQWHTFCRVWCVSISPLHRAALLLWAISKTLVTSEELCPYVAKMASVKHTRHFLWQAYPPIAQLLTCDPSIT